MIASYKKTHRGRHSAGSDQRGLVAGEIDPAQAFVQRPDKFLTPKEQEAERKCLFLIIEDLELDQRRGAGSRTGGNSKMLRG